MPEYRSFPHKIKGGYAHTRYELKELHHTKEEALDAAAIWHRMGFRARVDTKGRLWGVWVA